jgi:probable FeS assembly SUF system protein SufT
MSDIKNLYPQDTVVFGRDCEVTQIPSGTKVTVPKDTEANVGQTLGGFVTLQIPSLGMLAQVSNRSLDALLKNGAPVAVPVSANVAGEDYQGPANEADVWKELKTCYDPEIPLNIVDLGLVYDVKLTPVADNKGSRVDVKMTLTAMGCGMGPAIAAQARDKILTVPGVKEADVAIVWDPPWNQSMISDEGKKRLGLW